MLCFVLINSVLLNLLCVWILFWNASSHSCFMGLIVGRLCQGVAVKNLNWISFLPAGV